MSLIFFLIYYSSSSPQVLEVQIIVNLDTSNPEYFQFSNQLFNLRRSWIISDYTINIFNEKHSKQLVVNLDVS